MSKLKLSSSATGTGNVTLVAPATNTDYSVSLPEENGTLVVKDASGNATFDDGQKVILGAGSDLQIYHDGGNSVIADFGTGSLFLAGTDMFIQNASNENYITCNSNSTVKLYYDNAEKLATTSTGVDVTGTMTAKRGTGATHTAFSGSAQAPDMANYQNFIYTVNYNFTLQNPTTEMIGQSGFFCFKQDSNGGYTVSLGDQYLTPGGVGLTLSGAANAIDVVPYIVIADGQILLGQPQLAFA